MITINITDKHGETHAIEGAVGDTLRNVAIANRVAGIEGACGGFMACGTCHAYIAEPWFSALPPAEAGEAAMLEYGINIEPNSRLLCQITITQEMDGIEIQSPPSQVDF